MNNLFKIPLPTDFGVDPNFAGLSTNDNVEPTHKPLRENGREDRIRTCDILLPKQALHQAELLPELKSGI